MSAWPALETVANDGWIHRFAGGYTRRANSVHPLDAGLRTLDAKIDNAERLYRDRGLASIFKLTPASRPPELDRALERRGYAVEAMTGVHVADTLPTDGPGLRVESEWTQADAWRDACGRLQSLSDTERRLHETILASIARPTAFASIDEDGRTIGCALGVVEAGWIGVFDVVVDPAVRRCGHGERLMRGLLAWGRARGASRAYLQVMTDNAPALALYRKLGFREAYPYWYRVKR